MAKKDDLDAFEDDGWDFGPPSARRSSLRPGARRSLRPAAEAVRAVEAQRKNEAQRLVDPGFLESGWSEPPQAPDDEPTLIAASNAVAAALSASGLLDAAPRTPATSDAPEPANSESPEREASVSPAQAVSESPAPAVSVAPALSAPAAARRAAVRPAAARTGPQPSLAQTARLRATTPIAFPPEARPSVPALSVPAAAATASLAAAAPASMPPATAGASAPPAMASLAAAPASVAAASVAAVSSLAPALEADAPVALASGPSIELASEPSAADSRDEPDSVSGARLVHPSRRAPSSTASFRPVVPELPSARPVPRKRMTVTAVLPLVSLVLSTLGIGFSMFGGSPSAEATTAERLPASVEAAPLAAEPRAVARGAKSAGPSSSPKPAAAEAAALPRPRAVEALPRAAAPAVARPVAGETVAVELSVYPIDAAVGYLGIMQKGGPRYTFEVPKGKSIAVEVARKGYGTRKVTLDGSQSKITIGLRKAKASDGS